MSNAASAILLRRQLPPLAEKFANEIRISRLVG